MTNKKKKELAVKEGGKQKKSLDIFVQEIVIIPEIKDTKTQLSQDNRFPHLLIFRLYQNK